MARMRLRYMPPNEGRLRWFQGFDGDRVIAAERGEEIVVSDVTGERLLEQHPEWFVDVAQEDPLGLEVSEVEEDLGVTREEIMEMTVPELRAFANAEGLVLGDGRLKVEIQQVILDWIGEQENPDLPGGE